MLPDRKLALKTPRFIAAAALALLLGGTQLPAAPATTAGSPLAVELVAVHGPQRPTAVPLLPGLPVGKQLFNGPLAGRPRPGEGYRPIDADSFAVDNGRGVYNFVLTTGGWRLHVGERPRLRLAFRTASGAYASPALLPDLGVAARFRLVVAAAGRTKYLDEFSSIAAVLSPGAARWDCADDGLGLVVKLRVQPLLAPWGFVATAEVSAPESKRVVLTWETSEATPLADHDGCAEFSSGKYARIFVGAVEQGCRAEQGKIVVETSAGPARPRASRLLCVWGYSDYDRQGVAEAYRRLEFRPFDPQWLEGMKRRWFEHWIGGGMEPGRKFVDARGRCAEVLRDAEAFWARQAARLRIKTPDARLDNVVNHVSAHARVQFEYPGFIDGPDVLQYGTLNRGCYGFEAAGMHDEAADTLHFVAGTQDISGRQRSFTAAFAVGDWHEDADFYFAEQCWFHWRWTGDGHFLRAIWPAARRALEHGLAASDPDGGGLMTGYYAMWNCDQNNSGGFSALQTALGWAALRAGRDMAAALDDRDYSTHFGGGRGHDPDYARRYHERMEQTERQYLARLWRKDAGAWSSAEFNGVNRPRPQACEQNYAVWRGIGTPQQSYMAMRYVRENLHCDIGGSTFEFVDDWWPIQWSHHYVASGDTCTSFHSACAAGDVDGHWSAFQSVAESAYVNGGAMWQATGSNSMELEPLFLAAVVDGLFGLKPWFGENLLVVRPSPPATWNDVQIAHCDASYRFHRDGRSVVLQVTTPVPRRVRAELPVRAAVAAVLLDGKPAAYSLQSAVGAARVVVEADAARQHCFEVRLAGDPPTVKGSLRAVAGVEGLFTVRGAAVAAVHDPQDALGKAPRISGDGPCDVLLVPARPGKPTLFFEFRCGQTRWLHPLDLDVHEPWSVVERYIPAFHESGPAVASPSLDARTKTLTVELANGGPTELAGRAKVTVAGRIFPRDVRLPPRAASALRLSLEGVWEQLSPGSLPVKVELLGRAETIEAVAWDIGPRRELAERLCPLDLGPHCNAEMDKLFAPATRWRIDYTGFQHGVDRRYPMPLRDELGYVLTNSVMSIFQYGTLPEQWPATRRVRFSGLQEPIDKAAGVPFRVEPNRLLALCCTQPYEQFPSRATIKLPAAMRAEKLYLLTANLVKTLKCYYPGAELVVRYVDGSEQIHAMIPPYTMPSLVGNICPRARAVRVGQLQGDGNTVADAAAYLSVTDVVLDPTKPAAAIELRCTATETLLGVAGMTLLKAR